MRMLMKSPLLLVVVLALLLGACTRKQESSVSLSLDLAGLQASRKAQSKAFATSKSLSALALPPSTSIGVIVINVTGPGINAPIFSQWNAHDAGASSTPPSQIIIEGIPKGDNRLEQALVVYDSTPGSAGGFYYDEVGKSFVEDAEKVDLALKVAGTAGVGDDQISGRYLTSATAGPTGKLSVYFQVPNHPGSPAMLVDNNQEIFGGWFRTFALEGAQLLYKVDDGSVLFGGAVGADSASLTALGAQSVRVSMPASYRSESNGATTTYNAQAPTRSVYGFFGPGAAGKQTCYYNGSENINGAYADNGGVTPLTWNPSATVPGATYSYPEIGGAPIAARDGAGLCTLAGTRNVDYLSLNDGSLNQHDTVLGFKGPFVTSSGGAGGGSALTTTLVSSVLNVKWTFLPGVQTSGSAKGIDGVDVFGRVETTSQYSNNPDYKGANDGVNCSKLTSLSRPFSNLGSLASDPNNQTQTLAVVSMPAGFGTAVAAGMTTTIVCPFSIVGVSKIYYQSVGIAYPGSGGGAGGPPASWSVQLSANAGATPTIYNQTCVPVMVGLRDANSQPANGTAGVTLSASDGGQFYTDPTCAASFTAWPYNVNSQSQLWYKSTGSGSVPGTISVTGGALTPASVGYNLANAPGSADTLVFMNVPSSIQAFKCYPVTVATVIGASGVVPALYSSNTYPVLNGPSFYTDSNCQSMASSVQFGGASTGASVQQLWFSYNSMTNAPVTFNASGFGGTVSPFVVSSVQFPGAASQFRISFNGNSSPNQTYAKASCLNATVTLVDAQGNPTPMTSALAGGSSINVNLVSGGVGTFYMGSCNSVSTTTVNFTADGTHTSAQLLFKPTVVGTGTTSASFTATAPAQVVSGSVNLTVTPEVASQIIYVFSGQAWTPGSTTFTAGSIDPHFVGLFYPVDVYAVLASNSQVDTSYVTPVGASLTPAIGAPFNFLETSPIVFTAADNGHKVLHIRFNSVQTPYYVNNSSFLDQSGGLQIPGWPFYNLSAMAPSLSPSNVFVYSAGGYQPHVNTASCQPVSVQTGSGAFSARGLSFIGATTAGPAGLVMSSQTGSALHTDPACGNLASSGTLISNSTNQALLYGIFPSVAYGSGTMNVSASPSGSGFGYDGYGNSTPIGSFTKYVFLGPGQVTATSSTYGILTGVCQPYILGAYDTNNNSLSVTQPTVSLTATGGGGGQFYSEMTCTTAPITATSFSSSRTALIYFKAGFGAANNVNSVTLNANDGTQSGTLNVNTLNYQ